MATLPNTVVDANKTNGASLAGSALPKPEIKKDQYGRDAFERTVELDPAHAEAINIEVADGRWQTYDDALKYVLQRGLAEIKRQRDAARQLAAKTVLKAKQEQYQRLLASNPALIANADFVKTMMTDMGLTAQAPLVTK